MKIADTNTIAATIAAAGKATWLYANVISGLAPRSFAADTAPPIPSSKLTANDIRVTINVTSSTRTGIRYQRSLRSGVSVKGTVITYTRQGFDCRVRTTSTDVIPNPPDADLGMTNVAIQ